MKRMPNDDFLKPLKHRPGLYPRQEFKQEVEAKLQGIEIKKHKFKFIKGPLLVSVVFLLMFAIFSNDFLVNFKTGDRNTTIDDKNHGNPLGHESKVEDMIKWNGSIFINRNDGSEIISGELIGTKLGTITKKVSKNKDSLNNGEATLVDEGTMIYSVVNTKDIAIKRNNEWIKYKSNGIRVLYISEDTAIEIAKEVLQNKQISWNTEFIKEPSILGISELQYNPNPIWKIVGMYPMGNKDIFYIDAVTGKVLLTGEMESEGFGQALDEFIELKEFKDDLNETTYVYSGEINLLLSEKAKIELKNGTSFIVSLSGEETSTQLDPIQIVNPKDEISIPFEFDLDSKERIHTMKGNLKLFIEMKGDHNVIILKKELKAFSVE